MDGNRVVIKLGSSIVLTEEGQLEKERIEELIRQIKMLQQHGYGITLVVSGAVAVGRRIVSQYSLGDSVFKQMIAGIGQVQLMSELQHIFLNRGLHASQMLLTQEDLSNKKKRQNIKKIIDLSNKSNTVMVINENDAVELNNFGGNDYLAYKIAELISSDYLLLLTDVEGVYSIDKTVLKEIQNTCKTAEIKKASKVGGTGSIHAKIDAAKQAAEKNIETYITSAYTKNVLLRLIVDKEHIGTKVIA